MEYFVKLSVPFFNEIELESICHFLLKYVIVVSNNLFANYIILCNIHLIPIHHFTLTYFLNQPLYFIFNLRFRKLLRQVTLCMAAHKLARSAIKVLAPLSLPK